MQSSVKLYGIANCDTIKKAKAWLKNHDIEFEFHHYRKQGLEPEQLLTWVDHLARISPQGAGPVEPPWQQLA